MQPDRLRRRRLFRSAPALVFGLYCLLSASRWLLEGAWPALASSPPSEIAGTLFAAALFLAVGNSRLFRCNLQIHEKRQGVGLVLLLGAPAVSNLISGGRIHSGVATLALALVPVVSAVLEQQQGSAPDLPGRLWPGLAGLAGLLLLLPEPHITGVRYGLGVFSLPLLMAAGAHLLFCPNPRRDEAGRPWLAATGFFIASLSFLPEALRRADLTVDWRSVLASGGLEGALMCGSVICLLALGPQRWGAQFLWIPFLALAESIPLLRPLVDGRSWAGLLLLLVSAIRLSLRRAETSGAELLNLR